MRAIWEYYHDRLCDLYKQAARERDEGYDRPETNEAIDRAEVIEHAAWLRYRDEIV